MDHSPSHHSIQQEVRRYWKVFAALVLGTIITVGIANVHLGILLGIIVAVIVASVKGALVAGYFMHLAHERKFIYFVLLLTAVFVVAMVVLIMGTVSDQQGRPHGLFQVPQRHVLPGQAHEATHGDHGVPAGAATEESHVP